MITAEFIKLLLFIAGPLLAIVFIYYKGKADAERDISQDLQKSKDNLSKTIHEAEAKNYELEKKNEDTKDSIAKSGASELLRLWNEIGWGPKTPRSGKTDKKPPKTSDS